MYPGSQDANFLPFTCPMDHVLSPHDWRDFAYRDASFLSSPRLPPAARAGIVDVRLTSAEAYAALPQEQRARTLPRGISAARARRLLNADADARDAAILRVSDTRGLLCGIGGPDATREFNKVSRPLLRAPPWCARCDAGCMKTLPQWLSAEQIGSTRSRGWGGEWCLRTPTPPPFEVGKCRGKQ